MAWGQARWLTMKDFAKEHCRSLILGGKKKRKEDEAKHIRIHFKHGYKVSASEIVAVRRLLAVDSGNAFTFPGRKLSRRELFTYTFIGGSLVYLMYF